VVGFNHDRVVLMPLAEMHGIRPGSRVLTQVASWRSESGEPFWVAVLDGLGQPMDGLGPWRGLAR